MIPVEAVEAAARVLHGSGEQSWLAWDDITPFGREAYRSQARTILEAAAPHMLAGAWEEGKDAVWTFLGNQDPRRERPANPYGSTK